MTKVSTVYLGQFTWEHAEAIAAGLEEAGITWWHKQSGAIMQFISRADWGVRLYVDKTRLEDAQAIARRVAGGGESDGGESDGGESYGGEPGG